jgi:hypothetical protein
MPSRKCGQAEKEKASNELETKTQMPRTAGKKRATKGTSNPKRLDFGYVMDPYRGRLPVLQIGDAGKGEACYRISRSGDRSADWKDESELLSVHLTAAGKKEAERIRKLIA